MKNLIRLSLGFGLLFVACKPSAPKQEAASYVDPLIENMDSTLKPGADFFQYSCGAWLKKNPIPGNERSWGVWSLVQDETFDRMEKISEEAASTKNAAGSAEQKIGDFYFTGMDTVSIEKQGASPLKGELDKIAAIKDQKELMDVIAEMHTIGADPLFAAYVFQDEKRSDQQTLHLYQGGLGLPDRDYYFKTDSRTSTIRAEYNKHLYNTFRLLGDDSLTANKNSKVVMKIETGLAKASRKLEDLRDPYTNYNKMQLNEMKELAPSVDWASVFTGMHMKNVDSLIVGQPEFYKEVEKSLKTVSIDDWKVYLRWNLIGNFSSSLSSNFEKEHFHFYSTILSGVKEQRPRWKRVLDAEENAIGDLLGQLYVKTYVAPSVKKRYQDLTNNIFEAYREHIKALTWMSDSTKQKAIEKLNSVTTKVGYPDKWKDYSNLTLDRSSYASNILRTNIWAHDFMVNKLGKPVDRTEWDMTPQTYNAYYNPSNNEIVLPAAMFIIPGLPDTLADDAIIYGYAGASTIGHEITHGFDDQGRQFDAQGNLREWWTESDATEFKKRAKLIIQQFNELKVLDSLHVNGDATQGENIADLGGVVLGYSAFQKTEQFKSGKKINGLTPTQRFFLGYALSWLGHFREESIAMRLMTDVHSPNFLRINGPLANMPEFYEAFGIKEGDPMWRADSLRVKIW